MNPGKFFFLATAVFMYGCYIIPVKAFAITITSDVQGSFSPTIGTAPKLQNGGFLITPKGSSQPLGDGVDEFTTWNFDFNGDQNFSSFLTSGPVTSAKLSLTVSPKDGLFSTDTTGIVGGKSVSLSSLSDLPRVGSSGTVTLDLFKHGFNSQTFLGALNSGVIPWFYEDDAIVSKATLELTNDKVEDKKLIPESSSTFGLLVFAVLGAGLVLKRK